MDIWELRQLINDVDDVVPSDSAEGVSRATGALASIKMSHVARCLDSSDALQLYGRLLATLETVNNPQLIDELGHCYWALAGFLGEFLPASKELAYLAARHAVDCGWNETRQETTAFYCQLGESDYTEAKSALLERSEKDPYARLLLARLAVITENIDEVDRIIEAIPNDHNRYIHGQVFLADLKQLSNDYYGIQECLEKARCSEPWNGEITDRILKNRMTIAIGEILGWNMHYDDLDEAVRVLLDTIQVR